MLEGRGKYSIYLTHNIHKHTKCYKQPFVDLVPFALVDKENLSVRTVGDRPCATAR